MDIPKKRANIKQMNLMSFVLGVRNRPSNDDGRPEVDNPKDAKGKLKIGDVALKKPKKPRFNEMFVTTRK